MKYFLVFYLATNLNMPINHPPYAEYSSKEECEKAGHIMTVELRDNPPWAFQCRLATKLKEEK